MKSINAIIMDHLRLQSAFKFVAISRFGDGGQLMTAANLCLEAVVPVKFQALINFYPTALKGCRGIVFTHGVRMGGRAGGRAAGNSLSGL